ncbi:zeta toxin family protein [Dactylosporangium sp. NPDC048998]|uniref:zeta toxin family protein n=1 Tax=Dactylosporangium sp. NPDC048998 TaxID=3363976 RepID=UPI003718F058
MTVGLDRDRYVLPPDVADRIFAEDIAPERLTGIAQQQPVVVLVVGQPGAGKSVAQAAVLAQLGRTAAVAVDVDDLRTYHPSYEQLALADDRTAAAYTQRDAQRWLRMCIAEATSRRYDIVLSTTFADPGHAEALINRFRSLAYSPQVAILAVHELHSRLGVLDRYQADRAVLGYGRNTPPDYQRTAYTGLPATADRIDQHHLADTVHVYQRNGHQLYHNHLIDSQWRYPPAARAAIEHGRAARLGTDLTGLYVRAAALAQTLPAALRPDLSRLLADAAQATRRDVQRLAAITSRAAEPIPAADPAPARAPHTPTPFPPQDAPVHVDGWGAAGLAEERELGLPPGLPGVAAAPGSRGGAVAGPLAGGDQALSRPVGPVSSRSGRQYPTWTVPRTGLTPAVPGRAGRAVPAHGEPRELGTAGAHTPLWSRSTMTIEDGARDVLAGLSRHVGHTLPPDLAGLRGHGDLPVRVSLVGPDNEEIGSARPVRPELSTDGDGARYVAVTGYREEGQ